MTEKLLEGCRILVVEDEYYQGRETRTLLEQAGAEVLGPTANENQVTDWLQAGAVDIALVDLNLGRGANFNVAHRLQRHAVPFMILTGYDRAIIPKSLERVPALEKPVDSHKLMEQLLIIRSDET